MKLRFKLIPVAVLFFFFAFCETIQGQLIECCKHCGWSELYKVTAPSGLKLRAEQSTDSGVIALLSSGSFVQVCSSNRKADTIDGLKGYWVKTFFEGKEGFVFDAYLQKVENEFPFRFEEYWYFLDEYKDSSLSAKRRHFGLYATDSDNQFLFREMNMQNSPQQGFSILAEGEKMPLFIFSTDKSKEEKSRNISGRVVRKILYIGEKIAFDRGSLYATGTLNKRKSGEVRHFNINPYELRYQYPEEAVLQDELLLRMQCESGMMDNVGYESNVTILFIGDLDGDNEDDILFQLNASYKGWYFGLFSTAYAPPGRKFGHLIIGGGGVPE